MIRRLLTLLRHIFLARRGRPIAGVMLALVSLLALVDGTEVRLDSGSARTESAMLAHTTAGLLAKPLRAGRQALFDHYQFMAPRTRHTQPVAIVEIDEQSLRQVGQWPWPRNRLAALIDAINDQQPAAIGLDMYMPEADATSPPRVAANLPPDEQALSRALAALPSHEMQLAAALRRAPVVLGAAGFDFATYTTHAGLRLAPVVVQGDSPLGHLRQFPYVLASLPELQAAAKGQGLLTVSADDGVIRRIPLVAAIGEQIAPSLAMEMLRVATGEPAIRVHGGRGGVSRVGVADLEVPTQPNGEIWLHFAGHGGVTAQRLSAADLLAGKVPAGALTGKLVLVGLTGSGLSDMRATPLGELVPGIEIQAEVLESFFDGRFLQRPSWLRQLELMLLIGLGLLMIWLIPRTASARGETARGTAPRTGGWIALILAGGLGSIVAGHALFRSSGLLFDAAAICIGLFGVLASLVVSTLIEVDRENKRLAAEQQRLREDTARVAGELAAARMIQMNSLPRAEQLLAGETRFAVAALLEPAREIGGDLYDFFMLDADHLFFIVGDVSGKGVPASLFMAVTKALAKSTARRGATNLATIMATANREISAENPESLFVTAVAGIYNAATGELLLCNAGHDTPLCLRRDGRIDPLASASGPPICTLSDFSYAVEKFQLAPGDTVLVFTDGLSEAVDAAGALYGLARIVQSLCDIPRDTPVEDVIAAVRRDLAKFVDAAEAADDLTLLTLQRH